MDNSFQCYKCGAKLGQGVSPGGSPAPQAGPPSPPGPPAPSQAGAPSGRFSLTRDDVAPAAPSIPGASAAAAAAAATVAVVGGIPVVTPAATPGPVITPQVSPGDFGSAAVPQSVPASPYGSAPVLNAPGGPLYGSGTVGGTGSAVDPQSFASKIAGYEYLSGIFWIVLGIIQCLTCVGAIAGAWNIYAATRRFRLAKAIRALDPGVPAAFQDAGPLVVMAAVNLILGGVIGVVFVAFDAYIRSQVLKNAHVFRG